MARLRIAVGPLFDAQTGPVEDDNSSLSDSVQVLRRPIGAPAGKAEKKLHWPGPAALRNSFKCSCRALPTLQRQASFLVPPNVPWLASVHARDGRADFLVISNRFEEG